MFQYSVSTFGLDRTALKQKHFNVSGLFSPRFTTLNTEEEGSIDLALFILQSQTTAAARENAMIIRRGLDQRPLPAVR